MKNPAAEQRDVSPPSNNHGVAQRNTGEYQNLRETPFPPWWFLFILLLPAQGIEVLALSRKAFFAAGEKDTSG
jgi:hypothetical protein